MALLSIFSRGNDSCNVFSPVSRFNGWLENMVSKFESICRFHSTIETFIDVFLFPFQMFMNIFHAMSAFPPPGPSNYNSFASSSKRPGPRTPDTGRQERKPRKPGSGDKQANPLISPTEKCKVCKEPAAKHIHYGAVTCFSCRAFFRRSIQNQTCDTYKCRKQGNCEITLKSVSFPKFSASYDLKL